VARLGVRACTLTAHAGQTRPAGADPWYCPGTVRARAPGGAMKRIVFLIAFVLTAVN
jgi:hypothetical protein